MTEAEQAAAAARKLGPAKTALIQGVLEAVAPFLKELELKAAALERRLAEVESLQKEFSYKGVWKPTEPYKVSNSVTDGGSLFICKRDNSGQRPGTSDHWQMAVRKGADAKDARR